MKIIILAMYFPPVNMIGAVRPYQIAKYLAKQGYDVTVITSYSDNYQSKDYEVDISGIKIINLPSNYFYSILQPLNVNVKLNNVLKAIFRSFIYPDFNMIKNQQFMNALNEYVYNEGVPDYIISMGLPFSLHVVAHQFKKKYNSVKWVADNRDLWAKSVFRKTPNFLRFKDVLYEKKVLKSADVVLVVTESMKKTLKSYLNNNIEVILNGYELKDVNNNISNNDNGDIVYAGTLYKGLRDMNPLFIALKNINYKGKIVFYGSEKNIVEDYMEKYATLNIAMVNKVSKSEIEKIMNNAKYLVVALGNTNFEKGVLTGKLFDYVRSRRVIIALCDKDSELAFTVNKFKLGVATRDPFEIEKFMNLNRSFVNPIVPELSIDTQLEKLLKILKELK